MTAIPQPPDQFWMVLGVERGAPTVRHPTRPAAEAEANRLARLNPGEFFVVLEAVSAVAKRDLDVITFRASERDPIPF